MKLLIDPAASLALQGMPRADAEKLLVRLLMVATSPELSHPWRDRLVTINVFAERVSYDPWYALVRLDYEAKVAVVDHIAKGDPNHNAETAILESAAAHEQSVGVAAARANHRDGTHVFRQLLSRR